METTNTTSHKKNYIKIFWNKIKWLWNKIWSSKLYTFLMLLVFFAIVAGVVIGIASYRGGFFNIYSDDLLQYYPYINNLFTKIKSGNLSVYDTTLFGGTSLFGSIYYLPFDIFTLIAFLLSYFIQAETAYSIVNMLKPMCGALLLYYIFARRNFNTKVAFTAALIYMIGGVTESYYIFPVYLGINFYAPLAILLIDWCLEKKGVYYFLLSIYSITVILYDFYMAYMLLAFACVYFVIACHTKDVFSFFGKNTIIKNKEFWIRFLEFMFFLLLGVAMTAFILLPSAYYVVNESSRNGSSYGQDEYNWFYAVYDDKAEGYTFSIRHYFTQWCNLFIANEPHRFCLNEAGDYMREHASFYITSGGLIYLVYFFFLKGKEENRLKLWVILLNIMFAMPIFAKIFCFNEIPYSRWFFIPYLINLYAATIAMNKNNFKLSDNAIINLIPLLFLFGGIGTLTYVLIAQPDIFIHYTSTDLYFYPLLVTSIILLGIYSFLLLLNFIFHFTKKNKLKNVLRVFTPLIMFIEILFAGGVIFSNVFNAYPNYYNNKNQMTSMKDNLVSYGYDQTGGYRINLYTNAAKSTANANILIGDVNFGRFFQSFYNTPLTTCIKDIYNDDFGTSWNRTFNGGYSLLSSNIFNVKYVVSHSGNQIQFPSEFYKELGTVDDFIYYEGKYVDPFIVYDSIVNELDSRYYGQTESIPLFYGYSPIPSEPDPESKTYEKDKKLHENYYKIKNSGVELVDVTSAYTETNKYFTKQRSVSTIKTEKINNEEYYKFTLDEYIFKDVIHVFPTSSELRRQAFENIYIKDTNGVFYKTHYYTLFNSGITPESIYVKKTGSAISTTIKLTSYSYDLVRDYIASQAIYQNKEFSLNGNKITLKFDTENTKTKIIKTGYTYSDDWKIKTDGYDTVNIDGGFLGVIVPEGTEHIDIALEYEPAGYKTGLIISLLSCTLFLIISGVTLFFVIRKRKYNTYISERHKETFTEVIRFLVVGGFATLCDYIIFYFFNLVVLKFLPTTVNLALATISGFTVGLIVNWLLQSFVFKYVSKEQTKSKKVFLKFVIISLIGLGITELGILAASSLYGKVMLKIVFTFDFVKLFMKCLMTCIVLVFNYFGRKLFVFKEKNNDKIIQYSEEEQKEEI